MQFLGPTLDFLALTSRNLSYIYLLNKRDAKRNTSLVAQRVKRLLTTWETWVQSLGWEDPLEKEMATHSSILAWKIHPMDRGAWWATVHGVALSQTRLSNLTHSLM